MLRKGNLAVLESSNISESEILLLSKTAKFPFPIMDYRLFLSPLESTIRKIVLPSLTSQPPPNDDMRSLFCLPCRLGRLGIPFTVTSPLVDLVLDQCDHIPYSVLSTQAETKRSLHNTNRQTQIDRASSIYSHLSPALQRLINIAQEKGSST